MKKNILISTGGSGGHVIPALVFYEHLQTNFNVFLSTDDRGTKFLNLEKKKIKIINTPKLSDNYFLLPINLFLIFLLFIKSLLFLKKNDTDILVSTGGYMSLPLCLAAKILKIKIYLFEPNMIIGRANSFFLKYCEKIFCYSKEIKRFPKVYLNKIIEIKPLLRKEFYSFESHEVKKIDNQIHLLIIGGSQGAKLFDSSINNTIIELSKSYKLKVFHQTSFLNYKNLKIFYNQNNIENQIFDFDVDILKYINKANLCITRAGASTLAELTFLNIPYLAIPFLLAKDNHQYENALFYNNKNCCWIIKEDELNEDNLTKKIMYIINNKEDYLAKKNSMKNFSYQNTWNKINQKLIDIFNEN